MKQSIIYSYFTVSPITSKIKDDQENYNVKSNLNIQNPHDKFFKETFGNSALAKDFLQNYLPQDILQVIDLQTIKPQKDTFINLHLQEYFSDLLFETNINDYAGYIYLLFEHKSYPDKNIPLQLLNYMLHIWQEKIDKQLQLPIVIPLVIYHGKNKWNVTENLGTMIEDYNVLSKEMRRFIPNFKYLVYDLSQFSDDEIKGSLQLKAYLTICYDCVRFFR